MSALTRFRRRRRCWALLALPALLLRALIPAGYMPVAEEQGLSIEFCPDAGALPPGIALSASAHSHHHHDHRHAGGGPDSSSATHHTPCLFTASGTLAPAPAEAALLAAGPAHHDAAEPARGPQLHLPSIVRAQSPRGPPRLA